MKHSRVLLRVLIAVLSFVHCGAHSATAQDTEALQKEKAEGAVVFYTSAGLTEMKPLVDGFSRKFPFIKVELYRAISEKLLNKILTEERAQTHRFDVVLTNTLELDDLITRGLMVRYKSPERNGYSDKDMDKDGYWTNVQSSYYVLGYNTKLVPAGSAPKDWPDVLRMSGKKNFAMDREEFNWVRRNAGVSGTGIRQEIYASACCDRSSVPQGPHTNCSITGGGGIFLCHRLSTPC